MAMAMGASGGQAPCMRHASNMLKTPKCDGKTRQVPDSLRHAAKALVRFDNFWQLRLGPLSNETPQCKQHACRALFPLIAEIEVNMRKSRSREPMWVKRGGFGAAPKMKGLGKRDITNKTHLPAASSGTIPASENPRVELGSSRWETSRLTTTRPRPREQPSDPPLQYFLVFTRNIESYFSGQVTGFSQVRILLDNAIGRWVFSGISRFPRPFIPAPLHQSPLSAFKTSLLIAAQISSLERTGHQAQQLMRMTNNGLLSKLSKTRVVLQETLSVILCWEHTYYAQQRLSSLYSSKVYKVRYFHLSRALWRGDSRVFLARGARMSTAIGPRAAWDFNLLLVGHIVPEFRREACRSACNMDSRRETNVRASRRRREGKTEDMQKINSFLYSPPPLPFPTHFFVLPGANYMENGGGDTERWSPMPSKAQRKQEGSLRDGRVVRRCASMGQGMVRGWVCEVLLLVSRRADKDGAIIGARVTRKDEKKRRGGGLSQHSNQAAGEPVRAIYRTIRQLWQHCFRSLATFPTLPLPVLDRPISARCGSVAQLKALFGPSSRRDIPSGRLACSPPAGANRVQSPAGSRPYFRMWESCRKMPLVGGFSRESPVSPASSFRSYSILSSIPLIGSQDLFPHSQIFKLFNVMLSL
ncbi:hypothetical protein PR048_020408, partial [Dryococelus australis]